MELQLTNIGMIKEANVKIDGLTVIAGENDTGKSTVGKALFSIFQDEDLFFSKETSLDNFKKIFYNVLKFNFDTKSKIVLKNNDREEIVFSDEKAVFKYSPYGNKLIEKKHTIFIETPIITNLFNHFSKLDTIQNDIQYNINNYPYLTRELYKQLKLELKYTDNKHQNTFTILKELIQGEFVVSNDDIILKRKDKEYNINTVATGIKSFGILQLLIKNNYLTKNSILILDEPEVHLHPKWQLKMAEIIVELVKNGVKIVVNSHSPYMIQALIKYARDEEIVDKSNFYLTKKVKDYAVIENVNNDLNRIFELLVKPMNEVFEL